MIKQIKKEDGIVIVEATLLLPFCIIMIVALFYAAIFMCQKANLQANVQNALIYYKNVDSDTYVEAKSSMPFAGSGNEIAAMGSAFAEPTYRFPYRFLAMEFDNGGFESFFRSMYKYMFFDNGGNIKFTSKKHNYIVYKEIEVRAEQTVRPAINLEMVGAGNSIDIVVTGRVVVADGDDFIRNVDFVVDIVNRTALGKKAKELVGKAVEFYGKFKTKFNVSD